MIITIKDYLMYTPLDSLKFKIKTNIGHVMADCNNIAIYTHNNKFVTFDFPDAVVVIHDLFINKQFRGKDHGSELLNDLVNQIKSNTNLRILLHCKIELVKFYELNGFTITRSKHNIYELSI